MTTDNFININNKAPAATVQQISIIKYLQEEEKRLYQQTTSYSATKSAKNLTIHHLIVVML